MKKIIIFVTISCMMFFGLSTTAFADKDGSSVQISRESVEDYSGTGYANLNTATDCVNGLINIVNDPNTNWTSGDNWTNGQVWENDFTANDSYNSDDQDLFAYCGHGLLNYGPYLADGTHDSHNVDRREIRWGDRDLEWALMFTCNFLTPSLSGSNGIGQMMNGAHVICGYGSVMWVTANGGLTFANQAITGQSVTNSWAYYAGYTQPPLQNQDVKIVVLIHSSTASDRLWGYGTVASDPVSYNSSTSGYYRIETLIQY